MTKLQKEKTIITNELDEMLSVFLPDDEYNAAWDSIHQLIEIEVKNKK